MFTISIKNESGTPEQIYTGNTTNDTDSLYRLYLDPSRIFRYMLVQKNVTGIMTICEIHIFVQGKNYSISPEESLNSSA